MLRDARFLDLHGRSRILSEWGDRILVVNFWATWCRPCLDEIPMLAAARKFYASRGVEIVGIAIDLVAKVIEFAAKMSVEYPMLVADANGIDLMRRLGNHSGGLPYTVFLDRNRAPVRHKLGALRREELDAALGELLMKYR
ncbi:MAG: TlpA family protein disulfide reductase [Burkholderiales bacterium]